MQWAGPSRYTSRGSMLKHRAAVSTLSPPVQLLFAERCRQYAFCQMEVWADPFGCATRPAARHQLGITVTISHRSENKSNLHHTRSQALPTKPDMIGNGPCLSYPPSNAKTRFQSFFMLITDQPLVFASVISESENVPTLVSGCPPAGP